MPSKKLQAEFASLIAHISRQWRRLADERLQPFGLTEATWLPLFYLSQAGVPMRQKQLAATLVLDSSSVVRILDALQTAGLVERREEAGDRRAKAIHLTALGRETAAKIESIVQQLRREVLGGLPEAELAAATEILRTVYQRLTILKGEPAP